MLVYIFSFSFFLFEKKRFKKEKILERKKYNEK